MWSVSMAKFNVEMASVRRPCSLMWVSRNDLEVTGCVRRIYLGIPVERPNPR